jgi:hypothetical protein
MSFGVGSTSNTLTTTRGGTANTFNGFGANLGFYAVTQYSGTSNYFYLNGTSLTSTGASSGNFNTTNFAIGRDVGSASGYWNGYIGELLVYNSFLSDFDRFRLQTYLLNKWAVTTQGAFVVTNLYAYYDASAAASYPGTGSVWYDLVGGRDATLFNSPTYSTTNGGYLSFIPGSAQYAQTTAYGTLTNFTVEVWHYYTGTYNGNYPEIVTQINTGDNINLILGGGGTAPNIVTGYVNNSTWCLTSSYTPTANAWYHIVGTYDGTNIKLYVNNSLVRTTASATSVPTLTTSVYFMRRWDAPEYWGGYLGLVRIYSSALSATDVSTNFNASRSRFGV